MTAQLDKITQTLKELILSGDYGPGQKLREVAVAEALQVSRTPVRLAMGALEKEGLLAREPNRGFRVREFTIEEIADAIKVRGELEAMAVRLIAEKGLEGEGRKALECCLRQAAVLLDTGVERLEDRMAWIDMNAEFHAGLITASGNRALVDTIGHICKVPLAGPRAIVFDRASSGRTLRQVRAAHEDHLAIYDAISRHQGSRAAALVREHAYKSSRNKRDNFASMKARRPHIDLPGLALVR